MKDLLRIILFLLVVGFLVRQFLPEISPKIRALWDDLQSLVYQAPCEEPIPYAVGDFDERFDVSLDFFLDALKDAEEIWENASGLDLFEYNPEYSGADLLKVNLVYDYRQETTEKLSDLGSSVEEGRFSYESVRKEFLALKSEYDAEVSAFNAEVQAFNEEQADYQERVEAWNKKGGAPKPEYDKLVAERARLEERAEELKAKEAEVNNLAYEVNALVGTLNKLAGNLNDSVGKYNRVGDSRGESFEEGVYQREGSVQKIDIYEFGDRRELVRVLAHELGHALDLPHLPDPEAIMYELNQGENETLTETDLEALKAKCGIGDAQ